MKGGKVNSAILIIVLLSAFGVYLFSMDLESSDYSTFAISPKLKPAIKSSTQTITQSIKVIPENIATKVTGLKDTNPCKDFKARQIIDMYQKAMKKKDPNTALDAMQKWQTGLNCLTEKQAKDLDKQMATYVKGLSDKDAAAVLNPSINLIDLTQRPFEQTELYKEFSRRFADPKSSSEMKKGFSNAVGLILPDYNNNILERFTQMCEDDQITIKCSPVYEGLKNFFDNTLRGLGTCNIIDTVEKEFLCTKGLVCDPAELLATDEEQKEQALKTLGISSPEQFRSTFAQTSFVTNRQGVLNPTFSLLNPNSFLQNGQEAGSSAEKLCDILGKKKAKDGKKSKKAKDKTGISKIEDILGIAGNADECKLPDAQEELAKRTAEGNKNLATIKCFADPQVEEESQEVSFFEIGRNPDERCLISEGSGPTWKDFFSPECKGTGRVCSGVINEKGDLIRLYTNKGGKEATTTSTENPWEDPNNYDGQAQDARARCPEGASCAFNSKGHIIFSSSSGGNTYEFIDPSTGQKMCLGKCGREDLEEKDYAFIVTFDKDGNVVFFECRTGSSCLGTSNEEQRRLNEERRKELEEKERKKKEEQAKLEQKSCGTDADCGGGKCVHGKCEKASQDEKNKDKGREDFKKEEQQKSGRPGEEGSNPCSASEKRVLARTKCIVSTSVYGSKPSTLGTQKPLSADIKGGVTEKIIYPNPEDSKKCLALAVNKEVSDINAQLCKQMTQRGRPSEDGRGCNFEVSVELQRKPAKAGPDPGPGAFK